MDLNLKNNIKSEVKSLLNPSLTTNIGQPSSEHMFDSELLDASEEGIKAFERVAAKLKTQVGTEAYSSWFGRLKLVDYNRNQIRLSVPTAFLRSWINNHYASLLNELWREENPSIMRIEIIVRGVERAPKPQYNTIIAQNIIDTPHTQNSRNEKDGLTTNQTAVLGSPLDPRYTFDSFVEGAANRVALAAARSIAETRIGNLRFNPLFIHASVGQGKTHLLQAIASSALKSAYPQRVVYLTAEYFMWRFATAIRDNDALSFKERLRDIDLLIIDDMQFLQGKSIQQEFCHLLNSFLDSAKQVVVAADRPPAELESLDIRVRSRLQGGVALEIASPDFEMRLEILRRRLHFARLEDAKISISDDVLTYIARNISGSGRDLEGAFNQLLFRHSFEPNLSINNIDDLLGHLIRDNETKRIRIEEIQRVVARHYNVSKQDLLSNRRTRTIVKPRQIAMYLAKILTPRSLPEIGRRFGGRDHTTVLHAVRKIEDLVGGDQKLYQELELLKRLISEQSA